MTTDFMIVIRMCIVVRIVRGESIPFESWLHFSRLRNMGTWISFTGYLEVG